MYEVDRVKMFRYARRRNKETDLKEFLQSRTNVELYERVWAILQIGGIDESVDGETLAKIVCAFFAELDKRYGNHIHFLDWSLHMGESTSHIHERHVFDADDGYGHIEPQQEKALEALGIPLPDPDKKPGKNNNRKMTFDKICRDLFTEIC